MLAEDTSRYHGTILSNGSFLFLFYTIFFSPALFLNMINYHKRPYLTFVTEKSGDITNPKSMQTFLGYNLLL